MTGRDGITPEAAARCAPHARNTTVERGVAA